MYSSEVYFQDAEEPLSDFKEQDTNTPGSLKKNPMHKKFYEKDSPEPLFMATLRKLILQKYQESTCSKEDFPAKTSAMLEKELESRGVVLHYGNILSEPLAFYDQKSLVLKTFQHLLEGDSMLFSATLPRSGMMRNGIVYRLPPLVRLTRATEYSLYATPTTMDSLPPKSQEALLREATITRPGRSKPANLRDQVSNTKNWPTPTKTGCGNYSHYKSYPTLGLLNPTWVEWLMGFPIGWTELDALETQSFLNARKLSHRQSKRSK